MQMLKNGKREKEKFEKNFTKKVNKEIKKKKITED